MLKPHGSRRHTALFQQGAKGVGPVPEERVQLIHEISPPMRRSLNII
jgi:hypothetical protein